MATEPLFGNRAACDASLVCPSGRRQGCSFVRLSLHDLGLCAHDTRNRAEVDSLGRDRSTSRLKPDTGVKHKLAVKHVHPGAHAVERDSKRVGSVAALRGLHFRDATIGLLKSRLPRPWLPVRCGQWLVFAEEM